MFAPQDDNILDAETMFSYYTKCYGLFNMAASKEEMDAEDSKLIQEMVKKLNINDKDFECIRKEIGLPLWSSGQSSWLQIRRPGFVHYQKKKKSSGSGTGSTQPREYN
jgi:hypothetical protein